MTETADTTRDAIGLSERLRQMPSSLNDACRTMEEAATALDSLLKERDALQARVKELEGERNFWKSERDRIKAFLSEGDWQTVESEHAWRNRALRAEQERDEILSALDRLASFSISDIHAKTGKLSDVCKAWIDHKKDALAAIRRLAAGTGDF